MTQYFALKISGTGSWYSNVNGEHYQIGSITHVSIFKGSRYILLQFFLWTSLSWIFKRLQVQTIWSMMGIIIALLIRIRSYPYWMILSRRSYGCATKISYDTILCSQDIWDKILILQHNRISLSGMEYCPYETFGCET